MSTVLSFWLELRLLLITFFIVLIVLPILAMLTLTNFGFQDVSDKLVTVNAKNHTVEIHDLDGTTTTITETMIWPVNGVVTLEFGQPDPPYQPLHTGIDIANPEGKQGDSIHPFMKGTVIYAGEDLSGYGKHVIINNGNNITSLYGHMSAINSKVGATVNTSEVIGYEGQTGWATGPHVHFQINVYGIPVNPRTFLMGNP